MKNKKYLYTFVFFVLLASAAVFLLSFDKRVGNVEFTTLKGEKLSLEALKGKHVLVTFWATDCDSCLKEIPTLLDLYSRYQSEGLEIIGVSMYYDPPNHVIEFNKMRPLPYPITLDVEAKFANAFGGVKVTPTTFLLNASGEIVWQKVGLFEREEIESVLLPRLLGLLF